MGRTAKLAIAVAAVATVLAVGGAVVAAQAPASYWSCWQWAGTTPQSGAQPGAQPPGWGMMGPGWGMHGGGMMGYWGGRVPSGERISIERAKEIAEQYASGISSDLEVAEVMEFNNHFYAEIREKSTGIGAFEILIDPYVGTVHPEPGPNMMWNLKYGHMRWGLPSATAEMPVTAQQAVQYAQQWLDAAMPGYTASQDADRFYGYYTIHVERDGKVVGMLSVNGFSGQVWYHAWHGTFLDMVGEEEHQ